jgi:hypothetical protein
MKNYLYSISPEVCQVVCDGVDFSNDNKQPILDQPQKIHRNAQAHEGSKPFHTGHVAAPAILGCPLL